MEGEYAAAVKTRDWGTALTLADRSGNSFQALRDYIYTRLEQDLIGAHCNGDVFYEFNEPRFPLRARGASFLEIGFYIARLIINDPVGPISMTIQTRIDSDIDSIVGLKISQPYDQVPLGGDYINRFVVKEKVRIGPQKLESSEIMVRDSLAILPHIEMILCLAESEAWYIRNESQSETSI